MAKSGTKIGTWVILGLLFVGLIGFGTTGLSGRVTTLGRVGEKEITLTEYARELSGQIDAFSAQTGQPLPFSLALDMGIDRFALGRITSRKALDNEVAQMGISVGDDAVARQVMSIPRFQSGGAFSREAYEFVLERQGYTDAEYEAGVRDEITRTFVQAAVLGGVPGPNADARTIAAYTGETRDIRYMLVSADQLDVPPRPPTEDEVRAYYAENPEAFTAPEVRQLSYAWLTPDMIQDEVTVDETALRALYEERLADFVQPERRLVERLVMPDQAAADDAAAQLAVGGATFETLVEGRGLSLSDADMGDVVAADLGAAGEGVFAAEVGEVVGPLPSDFGPAFFRVNAVLEAVEVSFEEAMPDLREELAGVRARRVIDDAREGISDLMAGGAGVADLAERTAMEAGQIAWSEEVSDGIAAYAAFREAAGAAEEGAFPELLELEDGGLFVIELTGVTPPTVRPFEEVERQAYDAWTARATEQEVEVMAERWASILIERGDFSADMPEQITETGLTRRSFLPDAPAGLVEEVFGISEGGLAMAEEDGVIAIARLDAINTADPDDPDLSAGAEAIAQQAADAIADDLLGAYLTAVQERTEVTIDTAAVNAVHSQMQ